ncbi:MAG: lipid-binding SYLF domain-containing protein [Stellaceae bacterium]
MKRYAATLAAIGLTASYGAIAAPANSRMTQGVNNSGGTAAPNAAGHETAANPAMTNPSANATSKASSNSGSQKVIDAAARDLQDAKRNTKFLALMKKAKGIYVVPGLAEGAFIVGGKGGEGVLLEHKNGHWSDPAFMTVGSISVGAQVGGKGGPVIMLIMSQRAMNGLSGSNNFSFNANASFTIINFSTKAQSNIGKGDIIVWSRQSGGFVGASIGGTDIKSDGQADAAYYRHAGITTRGVLTGEAHNPAAKPLVTALPNG